MAWTWPLDNTPSRHNPGLSDRGTSLRARAAMAAARGRAMPPRSANHAVIDVAPSNSHKPDASRATTASLMRASSRSRRAITAARASPSTGMSSPSMTVPSSSNTP
jgi:hypothetical protein